jgi:hypothetical protein
MKVKAEIRAITTHTAANTRITEIHHSIKLPQRLTQNSSTTADTIKLWNRQK